MSESVGNDNGPVAVEFGAGGEAAKINYSVPLPGSHTGRRIMHLDLGMQDEDWNEQANLAGEDIKDQLGTVSVGGSLNIDYGLAASYVERRLAELGVVPSPTPASSIESGSQPMEMMRTLAVKVGGAATSLGPVEAGILASSDVAGLAAGAATPVLTDIEVANLPRAQAVTRDFLKSLGSGKFIVPARNWGGSIVGVPIDPNAAPDPTFLLVEVFGISSFLGDYGMGRTVKTLRCCQASPRPSP